MDVLPKGKSQLHTHWQKKRTLFTKRTFTDLLVGNWFMNYLSSQKSDRRSFTNTTAFSSIKRKHISSYQNKKITTSFWHSTVTVAFPLKF